MGPPRAAGRGHHGLIQVRIKCTRTHAHTHTCANSQQGAVGAECLLYLPTPTQRLSDCQEGTAEAAMPGCSL